MVQISTVFDKIENRNQKVFKVRGDESYARQTRITANLLDVNPFVENASDFDAKIVVTVYRGLGDSNLVIMDNDDTIGIIGWASTDTTRTITVEGLSYGISHNIKFHYVGNTECLKSTSNLVDFTVSNPNLQDTHITMSDRSVTSNDLTLSATLLNSEDTGLSNLMVEFYIDEEYKGYGATNNSGTAQCSVTDISNRKHIVTAVFNGDNSYGESSTTTNLSVGYNVQILSYPQVFINGADNIVRVKVSDYLDNLSSNRTVSFAGATGTTNNEGIATITVTDITGGSYSATCTINSTTYSSTPITVKIPTVTGIDLTTDNTIVTSNSSAVLTAELKGTGLQPNTPITLSGGVTGEYNTGLDNRITASFSGTGGEYNDSDVTITASYGSYSDSVTIEDLLMYWKAGSNRNKFSSTCLRGKRSLQSDGIRLDIPNGDKLILGLNWGSSPKNIGDYDLSFTSTFSQNNILFHVGTWNITNGKPIWGGASNWEDGRYGEIFFGKDYTFTVKKRGTNVKIYSGSTKPYDYTLNSTLYPCLFFKSQDNNKYVKLNNFKLKLM